MDGYSTRRNDLSITGQGTDRDGVDLPNQLVLNNDGRPRLACIVGTARDGPYLTMSNHSIRPNLCL